MESMPLDGRAPVSALADVEKFVDAAQHLKALTLQRAQLRRRKSQREHVLSLQIECIGHACADQVKKSPRLAELWRQTQAELRALEAAPPEEECNGAAARAPCDPRTNKASDHE